MSRSDKPDSEVLERSAAKEQLVGLAGAAWGAVAAQRTLSRLRAASKDEVSAVIDELARSIVAGARRQFGDDPVLAETWREAANEAACAQLDAGEDAA